MSPFTDKDVVRHRVWALPSPSSGLRGPYPGGGGHQGFPLHHWVVPCGTASQRPPFVPLCTERVRLGTTTPASLGPVSDLLSPSSPTRGSQMWASPALVCVQTAEPTLAPGSELCPARRPWSPEAAAPAGDPLHSRGAVCAVASALPSPPPAALPLRPASCLPTGQCLGPAGGQWASWSPDPSRGWGWGWARGRSRSCGKRRPMTQPRSATCWAVKARAAACPGPHRHSRPESSPQAESQIELPPALCPVLLPCARVPPGRPSPPGERGLAVAPAPAGSTPAVCPHGLTGTALPHSSACPQHEGGGRREGAGLRDPVWLR